MQKKRSESLRDVAAYYAEKLAQHGETARGVDWNGEDSQRLRFAQICKILECCTDSFSLNDLGCGYGALFDFVHERYPSVSYCGIDVSEDMVTAARIRHNEYSNSRFIVGSEPDRIADYSVASGIFNVRLDRKDDEWLDHLQGTLDLLDRTSRLGFSFNCLTSYSDENKKRDYLYYADPCRLFDLCKRRYSRDVALLHDYGMYEFTILVRKSV